MAHGQMFSQRFGYATHVLAYMAKKPFGELTTLPEVADWLASIWPDSSATYLSNVMQRLARGGVLRSHRGIAGGYSLARPADETSLRDVAEVVDGVSLERCALSLAPECPSGRCNISRTLRRVEELYLDSLSEISIAQVADGLSVKVPR
jgi:Rrf2 family protein